MEEYIIKETVSDKTIQEHLCKNTQKYSGENKIKLNMKFGKFTGNRKINHLSERFN